MTTRSVHVFLATPSDLAAERSIYFDLVPTLGCGVDFVPTGYETVPAATGPRPQALINQLVDTCEVFVLVLHKRWGQRAEDTVAATSYTEEEFARASARFNRTGKPTILCFFKHVDVDSLADPGPQLASVLAFKKRLEDSRRVLYRGFNSESEFSAELAKHLRAYANSDLPDLNSFKEPVLLPIPADDGPDESRRRDIALSESAVLAARDGRIEEASQLFASISQTTVNVQVLDTARQFFEAVGNEHAAHAVVDRKLALLRDRRIAAQEYMVALTSRGLIDDMIASHLAITPPADRPKLESVLHRLFGPRFNRMMLDVLSENFTVGELRALVRFCSGEGASISSKMGQIMGAVLPRCIQQVAEELEREGDGAQCASLDDIYASVKRTTCR